jgi:hypothetical protein
MHWYDEYPHIGYDVNGKKIMKPATADELDKFLSTMDDPDSWQVTFVDCVDCVVLLVDMIYPKLWS